MLLESGLALSSELSLPAVLRRIVELAMEVTGARYGALGVMIQTYADALWWAAATVTTVGYGDVFPKTPAGRGIAFLLMLIGISMFGVLTARVAALFVEASEEDHIARKLDEVLARLDRLERELAARPTGSPTPTRESP